MNKRKLHHALVELRVISTLGLLVAAVFFGVIAIFALRANNTKMIELRDAVYTADRSNYDVEEPLRNLREHVHGHMNTNLTNGENAIYPPIQLEYTYERLVEREQGKLKGTDVYEKATKYCEARFPAGQLANGRVQCVAKYIEDNSELGNEVIEIPEDLYKFDFVSPTWSPDLAGWSLLLAALFGILFVLRAASELIIRFELKKSK